MFGAFILDVGGRRIVTTADFILEDDYLRAMYRHLYGRLGDIVQVARNRGPIIEIGSGPGLVKYFIPGVITSDIDRSLVADICLNALALPFPDQSVAGIIMKDALHHIPDVESFIAEAQRVLIGGGLVVIVDPYWGFLARLVYRYLHQEQYDPSQPTWSFDSSSPWDSNQALLYILLRRDRTAFEEQTKCFEIKEWGPLIGPSFLLSGGVSRRTIISGRWLARLSSWENRRGRWFNPFRFQYLVSLRKSRD